MAILNKFVRKFSQYLRSIHEKTLGATIPKATDGGVKLTPLAESLEDDLQQGAEEVSKAMKEKQDNLLKALNASQFAVTNNKEWDETVKGLKGKVPG